MPTATDLQGVTIALTDLREHLVDLRSNLLSEVSDLLQNSLQAGEEAMHTRIETAVTPTGERRALLGRGQPGRIDTGAYYDGVDSDVEADSDTEMSGYLGWLDDARDYFEAQEDGFEVNGHEVEAVHALLDGATIAKQQFKDGLIELVDRSFS